MRRYWLWKGSMILGLTLVAGAVWAGVAEIGGTPQASGSAVVDSTNGRAVAGEKLRPPTPNRESTAGLPKEAFERPTRSVIKCWQWGRLIFEERDWLPGPQAFASLKRLAFQGRSSRHGHYDRFYLADFGDTFCFIKGSSKDGAGQH